MRKILNLTILFLSFGILMTSCTKENLTSNDALEAENELYKSLLSDDDGLENRSDGVSMKIKSPIYQALRLQVREEERLRFTNKFVDRGGYAVIYNFVTSSSLSYKYPRDLINLKKIDANRNTEEDDKFVIVDEFTGTAGQLVIQLFSGSEYNSRPAMNIKGDVDGDGVADLEIQVNDFAGVQNLLQDMPRIKL